MRTIRLIKRTCALALVCSALSLTMASSAFAIGEPRVTPVGGAKVTAAGSTFVVATGSRVACPADALPDGCTAETVMTAIVSAPTPRLVVVGRGATKASAGGGARIHVRLNAVGAAELRRSGQFRGRLQIGATARENSATGELLSTMNFSREQKVMVPAMIVTQPTALRAVKLLPGQRLVVRFPENLTTLYRWHVTPLAPTAALRRTSMRVVPDPCGEGMVGCSSTRIVTYVSRARGTTNITAGLFERGSAVVPSTAVTAFGLRVVSSGTPLPLPRIVQGRANGSSLSVGVDDRITVRLPGASASTGYAWRVIIDRAAKLKPFAHASITADCREGTGGCPQMDEFSYASPAAAGPAMLKLGLYAPGSSTPTKRFVLQLYPPVPLPAF